MIVEPSCHSFETRLSSEAKMNYNYIHTYVYLTLDFIDGTRFFFLIWPFTSRVHKTKTRVKIKTCIVGACLKLG